MTNIHSTAIVSEKAKIGENVVIAPYVIIEDDVEIGDGTQIGPHSCIYNGARIGKNVKIYQSVSVSHVPQDLKYANQRTYFYIGDNTTIHEFVTLHRGTIETGKSEIGKNCLLMAYSHIAHDCKLGDNVILANSVQIGGHVTIDDFAIIGGCTPVHQFCIVGKHVMIGGAFKVVQDVPPYCLAGNTPLNFAGLNIVGLRRRGFTHHQIDLLKDVYNLIYYSGLKLEEAKQKIEELYGSEPLAKDILSFIDRSKRGLLKPQKRS